MYSGPAAPFRISETTREKADVTKAYLEQKYAQMKKGREESQQRYAHTARAFYCAALILFICTLNINIMAKGATSWSEKCQK